MRPWIVLSALLAAQCVGRLSAQDEDKDEAEEKHSFQVSISGRSVEVTCPKAGPLQKDRKDVGTENSGLQYTLRNYSSGDNGLYSCGSDYLYLHAYVCDACTEVSPTMVACAVIADCLITVGVCIFVYMFCKRKPAQGRDGGFTGGRKKGNKERPPPVPNPDYEPIQKRRQDVYDGLNHNVK
ncbi:T-cell surface glycoprotein CD3 epsilon chain isoform X2 [Eleutherodactylus coqui]|uniref:T-cell surface glycoprotein CD3 epsilon chain isoform X2 n=1 Tax=Eleutherodactylus coqui TaxID=57060 RepID=UPI003462BAC2